MNYYHIRQFCSEPLDKIENWDKAIAEQELIWDCHHRKELTEDGKPFMTKQELIENGLYWKRPASELIMLTHAEHASLHSKALEKAKKMHEAWKGKHHNEKAKQKISESKKGCCFSEEARQKMSDAHKGRKYSEKTRCKMSNSHKGKNTWTKGTHWYNNGKVCIKCKECPPGFVAGRLKFK